jgi:hypothetical protein
MPKGRANATFSGAPELTVARRVLRDRMDVADLDQVFDEVEKRIRAAQVAFATGAAETAAAAALIDELRMRIEELRHVNERRRDVS